VWTRCLLLLQLFGVDRAAESPHLAYSVLGWSTHKASKLVEVERNPTIARSCHWVREIALRYILRSRDFLAIRHSVCCTARIACGVYCAWHSVPTVMPCVAPNGAFQQRRVVFCDQSTSLAAFVWPPSGDDAIETACRYVPYQLCADPAIRTA